MPGCAQRLVQGRRAAGHPGWTGAARRGPVTTSGCPRMASSRSPRIRTSAIYSALVARVLAVGQDRRRHQLEHGVLADLDRGRHRRPAAPRSGLPDRGRCADRTPGPRSSGPVCSTVLTDGRIGDRLARPAAGRQRTVVQKWPADPQVIEVLERPYSGTYSRSTRADGTFGRHAAVHQLPAGGDLRRRPGGRRRRPFGARSRGSPRCPRCPCAGRSPPRRHARCTPTPRSNPHAVVGPARPARPTDADRARAARGVDVVGIRQRPVHPDRKLQADDFGVGDAGIGVAGSVVRERRRRAPRRRRRRPHGRRRGDGDGDHHADRHGRPAGACADVSATSSPPRRSVGRSAWRSTS